MSKKEKRLLSLRLRRPNLLNHFSSYILVTVAHNCHGNTKILTAKTKTSRQKQVPYGKTKTSRQRLIYQSKNKNLTAKPINCKYYSGLFIWDLKRFITLTQLFHQAVRCPFYIGHFFNCMVSR